MYKRIFQNHYKLFVSIVTQKKTPAQLLSGRRSVKKVTSSVLGMLKFAKAADIRTN